MRGYGHPARQDHRHHGAQWYRQDHLAQAHHRPVARRCRRGDGGWPERIETVRDKLFELRENIGYLFQNSALLTDFSVFENVAFPLRQHLDLPEELMRNIVLTKLQAVGLRGAAGLMPSEFSGGMARRVALARAIVFDPMLILYDEPFVGLDPIALNQVLKLIRTLNETLGITSVLVAHELSAVAGADHIYLIADGKIAALRRAEDSPVRLAVDAAILRRRGRWPGAVPLSGAAIAPRLGLSDERPAASVDIATGLAQIGDCGLFLLRILAAVPLCCATCARPCGSCSSSAP